MTVPCCPTLTGAGRSRRRFLASAAMAGVLAGWSSLAPKAAFALPGEGTAPAAKLRPFDMADVTLLESPFLHAQRMTEKYLLSLDPDRMLHNFRVNAGLKPKAPGYGGWESEPI